MNDIKVYDSSSIPKGDFFYKQWANPIIMLDGEPISSDIEDVELEVQGDMKLDSVPQLHNGLSFTQSSLARRNPTSSPKCSAWTRWNGSRIS